jgi:hypothetical protein
MDVHHGMDVRHVLSCKNRTAHPALLWLFQIHFIFTSKLASDVAAYTGQLLQCIQSWIKYCVLEKDTSTSVR